MENSKKNDTNPNFTASASTLIGWALARFADVKAAKATGGVIAERIAKYNTNMSCSTFNSE